MERLCRLSQLPFEEVKVRKKGWKALRTRGRRRVEVLEQRRENGESLVLAQSVEGFEKHHHALRGALVQCLDGGIGLRPTFFAISAGFLNNSIMVRCKAVADISTF